MKLSSKIQIVSILLVLVALSAFVISPMLVGASNGELRVHMLKIGDGRADCFIVDLPNNQKMVIDVPGGGSTALINKLNALGYGGGIKYLVGTHNHADHLGGMDDFLNSGFNINNTEIYYPKGSQTMGDADYNNMVTAANKRGLTIKKLVRHDVILDTTYNSMPLQITVVGPVPHKVDGGADDYDNINNASLCLKVRYGSKAMLFMADALAGPEADILADTNITDMWGQVLKVGHHGIASAGNTSTTDAFLNALNIKWAFIPNDNATINADLKTRLQSRGIKYWVAGATGDCSIYTDGNSVWTGDKTPTWQP